MALIGYVLIVIGAIFGTFMLGTMIVGAGFEPTSRRKVRKMLAMSGAGPDDVVFDLGSGDGRIIVEAAKTFHSRAVGIEADPVRVFLSRLNLSLSRVNGRARVVWGNFFHADLKEATIVTLFLSQGVNRRLREKLAAELRPGTRVVSYVWTFEDWTPTASDPKDKISLYVIA